MPAATVTIPLDDAIGEDSFDDFKKDTKHAATATLIDGASTASTIASVTINDKGELLIALRLVPDGVPAAVTKVAWIVDTEAAEAIGLCKTLASNDLSMICQEPTRVGRFKRRRDRQSPSRGHG